jgi:hypothetical protein
MRTGDAGEPAIFFVDRTEGQVGIFSKQLGHNQTTEARKEERQQEPELGYHPKDLAHEVRIPRTCFMASLTFHVGLVQLILFANKSLSRPQWNLNVTILAVVHNLGFVLRHPTEKGEDRGARLALHRSLPFLLSHDDQR